MLMYIKEYITELSKYIIALSVAIYTLECFLGCSFKYPDKHSAYFRQSFWMFVVQLFCFASLSIESKNKNFIFFYVFVQVFLLIMLITVQLIYKGCNRILLNNMCFFLGTGLCMIARLSFEKGLKQFIIAIFSFIVSLTIPWFFGRFSFWKKLTWIYATAGVFLLSVVLIMGEVIHGSKISFSFQNITFQPSEFVKILFILFLAAALCENSSFKRLIVTSIFAGMHVIILVLSRDLGGALILFVTFIFMVFAATRNIGYLLAGILGGGVFAYGAYHLFDHIRVRFLAWLNPWNYIDNQGYQITQSLFAIGSGNWFGMGLYQGNPQAIPYVEEDFIFSAICEELGVIFGVCLILICLSCFVTIMKLSIFLKDPFYRLIACGVGVMYVFQVFLTIGGGIKFIPLTGVTLPLVSYGGSSCLTTFVMFFIIHSFSYRSKKEGVNNFVSKKKTEK